MLLAIVELASADTVEQVEVDIVASADIVEQVEVDIVASADTVEQVEAVQADIVVSAAIVALV